MTFHNTILVEQPALRKLFSLGKTSCVWNFTYIKIYYDIYKYSSIQQSYRQTNNTENIPFDDFITTSVTKDKKAAFSLSSCFLCSSYVKRNWERISLGIEPVHATIILTIAPGLPLQEEYLYTYNVTYEGFLSLIITGSVLDGWFYWHLLYTFS
jgi:hypothetical protein